MKRKVISLMLIVIMILSLATFVNASNSSKNYSSDDIVKVSDTKVKNLKDVSSLFDSDIV